MIDAELKTYLESVERLYCKVYGKEDYKLFKKNAEKFFSLFREYSSTNKTTSLTKKGLKKFIRDELISRIFLGIGCELLVKSVYLKKGYLINRVLNKPENKVFPYRMKVITIENIDSGNTEFFRKLNSNLHKLMPKRVKLHDYNRLIKKGLEIARIWRNKDTHIGGGYHRQSMEIHDIGNAVHNIYFIFYRSRFNILK